MRLLWFYLKTYFINSKQINNTNNIKSNTCGTLWLENRNIIDLLKVILVFIGILYECKVS